MSWKLCRRLFGGAVIGNERRLTSLSSSEIAASSNKDADEKRRPTSKNVPLHVFKRINWENLNLFGPILRRRSVASTDDDHDASISGKPSATTVRRKVAVRVVENGFRSIDGPAIGQSISTHQTLITMHRLSPPVAHHAPALEKLSIVDRDTSSRSSTLSPTTTSVDQRSRPAIDDLLRAYPLSGGDGGSIVGDTTDDWLTSHWFPDRTKPDTWPSVTAILQATMSAESLAVLEAWKKRMIDKLGVQGFAKYKRELFSVGTEFHRCIEDYLSGVKGLADIPVDDGSALAGHWRSLCAILPQVADAKLLETRIHHPQLCYTGVIDCVAKYRGSIVLIEWKTSQRPKPNLADLYETPLLQAVAYLGALRAARQLDHMQMDGALVVVAYAGGFPAHAHYLDEELCQHYWTLWLQRLHQYYSPKAIQ